MAQSNRRNTGGVDLNAQLTIFGEIEIQDTKKKPKQSTLPKSGKRGRFSGKSKTPFGSYEER